MLDLGREVEGHVGKFGVHRADDAQRVAGSVQKIGVAECDVGRAGPDLPPDILQDDLRRHDEEAAFVHRHDGTMQAEMQASAAGLDVANYVLRAGAFKMRVPLRRSQSRAAWNGKREALQVRPDNPSPMADRFDLLERVGLHQSLEELTEGRFVLPPDNRVRNRVFTPTLPRRRRTRPPQTCRDRLLTRGTRPFPWRQQVLGIQRGVQAVEADMAGGIRLADQLGHADAEAQGGVHRHGDPDESRAGDTLQINLLDRDVQTCRRVPRLLKESHRQGDSDPLVPKLVARAQQDRAWLPQRETLYHLRTTHALNALPSPVTLNNVKGLDSSLRSEWE